MCIRDRIKDLLLQINPNFSISPSREYAGKKDCSEFFVTVNLDVTEVPLLLERLNNCLLYTSRCV